MVIGYRLKELRESQKLSQGEIEKRTACSVATSSRVENGHTVPAIETLEKMARAWRFQCTACFIDGGSCCWIEQAETSEG